MAALPFIPKVRFFQKVVFPISHHPHSPSFFNSFFTKLAGQTELQKQIEEGWSASEIRNSWQDDLEKFKKVRANYLLYP